MDQKRIKTSERNKPIREIIKERNHLQEQRKNLKWKKKNI